MINEGQLLRNIVEKEFKNQQEFADKLNITRQYLGKLLNEAELPPKFKVSLKEVGIELFDTKYWQAKPIPYYDIDASAGEVNIFMEDSVEYVKSHYDIPSFGDCDCIINVFGDSMQPRICAGQMVALKRIEDKTIVPFGEAFLVVTKELRTIKLIMPGPKKGSWILKSVNKDYPEFEVATDKVLSVYIVKGIISKTGI